MRHLPIHPPDDTCQHQIGPPHTFQINFPCQHLPCVSTAPLLHEHMTTQHFPCVSTVSCHIDITVCKVRLYILYGLYNQHCFCFFGKVDRTRYLSHTMSVWSRSSCVGIMMMRPTHESVFKEFRAIWFLIIFGSPRSVLPIGKLVYLQKTTFSQYEDEGTIPSWPQSNWPCLDLCL
jgi:hypothetical protein